MPHSPGLASSQRLKHAVHRSRPGSREGLLERAFTFAFSGLVYPQIWEDPEIDMEALQLRPGFRMVAIASGGCNVLSYLTAGPERIVAVDLNHTHVALTRLKLAAARFLPGHGAFHRFFAQADQAENLAAYRRFLRPRLDPETRAYWEGRDWRGRPRITAFARGFYRQGLLGRFIGLAHRVARAYGVDPSAIGLATSLDEQRAFFEAALAPLFDRRLLRWALAGRASLFGLGIPPAQYAALAEAGAGGMAPVLKTRLERLACDFPLSSNYFAWQAFMRSYPPDGAGPLPPYLRRENFDLVRSRADRVEVAHASLTDRLGGEDAASLDAFVLLDAQDWMTDAQLAALWSEITRTARPEARVVFRTAGEASPLPGRLPDGILRRWRCEPERGRALAARDRSGVYGGLHIYAFAG